MPTAYERFCEVVIEHAARDRELDAKCQEIAGAFWNALLRLGFPPENLAFVKWGEREIVGGVPYQLAVRPLQDEGFEGVTMRVTVNPPRANPLFSWPELRMRYLDGEFVLSLAERTFRTRTAAETADQAAAYFVELSCERLARLPASWMRAEDVTSRKKALGFNIAEQASENATH